jgi:SH3-like domain-containing protein
MDVFECGAVGGGAGRPRRWTTGCGAGSSPPVKKTKPAAQAKPLVEKPVILSPGAATIVGKNINVRGKASFNGEVITKLQNGDAVTVIEQVILSKPKVGEPSQWAKIAFPATAHVWVHSSYLNADKTVKPKKLNIRTGAGENYSVVGTLEQGTTVKEISTKGNWTEIEAPADAFAFVAATFIQQDPSAATVPQVVSIQAPEATPTCGDYRSIVGGHHH